MSTTICPYCHGENGKHECNCWGPADGDEQRKSYSEVHPLSAWGRYIDVGFLIVLAAVGAIAAGFF